MWVIRFIWTIRNTRSPSCGRTRCSCCPPIWRTPIYRAESRERFETLLRADTRNEAINEFLPVNPDTADQDLRDVLVHGLIGAPDKAELSELFAHRQAQRARSPNGWGQAFPGIVETMELETGDTADLPHHVRRRRVGSAWMRTKSGWPCCPSAGMRSRPLLRGLYARQLDGFGREQAEPAIAADTTVEEPY